MTPLCDLSPQVALAPDVTQITRQRSTPAHTPAPPKGDPPARGGTPTAAGGDGGGGARSARCRVELSPHVLTLIRGPVAEAVRAATGATVISDGAAIQVALGFAWKLEQGSALVCGPSQVQPLPRRSKGQSA
jgi:hypothetical protein